MTKFNLSSRKDANIERFLTPPIRLTNEDTTRLAYRLSVVACTGTVLTLLNSIVWLMVQPERVVRLVFAAPVLLLFGAVMALVRSGRVNVASKLLLGCSWLVITLVTATSGGTRAPFFGFYVLLVMSAVIFSGLRAALFFGTLTFVTGLVMAHLANVGVIAEPFATPISAWLTQASIIVLVALDGYIIFNDISRSLQQAQHALVAREKTDAALRESEERFRLISSVTSDYTFSSRLNALGELEHVLLTGAFEAISGYTPDEYRAIGGWRATLHPNDRAQDERDMAALRTNNRVVTEVRIIKKGGEVRWVRVYTYPVWDEQQDRLVGINGGVQDITERKHAEEALRESEEKFRTIFELAPYGITVQRQGGVFTDFNQAFLDRWELSGDQVRGKNFLEMPEIWDPVDLQKLMRDLRASGRIANRELSSHRADGSQVFALISSQQLDLAGESIVLTVSVDITERKLAEEALRASEEEFRAFFEMSPYPIMIFSMEGRFADANSTFLQGIRLSREQVVGRTPDEIGMSINGKEFEDFATEMRTKIAAAGRIDYEEVEITYPDSRTGSFLFSGRSLELQAEPHILTIAVNITELRLAERALKRSEAHLRALLDATSDVAFLMSLDGGLLTLNEALAQRMGRTVEQMMGQSAFDFLKPDLRAERYGQFERVAQSAKPGRWEDESPTGWWDNSAYPVLAPDGSVEAFAVFSRDVTVQKRLEAELKTYTTQLENLVDQRTNALRRANEQLELILNTTTDALAFAHPNGDILMTNPAFLALFGDRAGLSIEDVLSSLADDRQTEAICEALLRVMYEGESQRLDAQMVSSAGQEMHIDLTLIPVRTVADDTRNGILFSGHDITQLKEVERFKARFVADAVHDLATPIAGLSTRLFLLQRSPEKLDHHVRALENQVQHLRNLVDDLRTLSQIDRGQMALNMEMGNVNVLAQRVFDIYEPVALSKNQVLILRLDPALPEVRLDPRYVERVLVNLVSNAINYCPEDKEIRIETTHEAHAAVVQVSDQGIGISAHDLAHIFERFYRADEARKSLTSGTGLGLAIAKEVIEMHGGSVAVTSQPGQGSTFTVRLPLLSPQTSA